MLTPDNVHLIYGLAHVEPTKIMNQKNTIIINMEKYKTCKYCGRGYVKREKDSNCYGRTEWSKEGRYIVAKKHKYIYKK